MRTFTNTLLFEQAVDLVPSTSPAHTHLQSIFYPSVKIIESDCGTLLGRKVELGIDLLGQTELSTGDPISVDRLATASNAGNQYLFLRTTNTCISQGGICRKCYRATFPADDPPTVGNQVIVPPEFIIQQEHLSLLVGSTSATLAYDNTLYDRIYVYVNDNLLDEAEYEVNGTAITFTYPIPADVIASVPQPTGTVTIRYAVNTTSPFVHWFSGTYGGSLVGLMGLPHEPFPLKPSLYIQSLSPYSVNTLTDNVINSPVTPQGILGYISKIQDPLEQAVLVSLLNSIYLI